MRTPAHRKKLDTTIGDLVMSTIDTAFEFSNNRREAYRLASIVLNKILNDSRLRGHRFGRALSRRKLLH
jgi:hypothetical protein